MKMVDYLISLGHRRIAIVVAEPYEKSIGQLRLEGYIDSLKKHGIQPDPALVIQTENGIGHFSMENGYRTTKRLMESGVDFTALYAVSDSIAIGSVRALLESGQTGATGCFQWPGMMALRCQDTYLRALRRSDSR